MKIAIHSLGHGHTQQMSCSSIWQMLSLGPELLRTNNIEDCCENWYVNWLCSNANSFSLQSIFLKACNIFQFSSWVGFIACNLNHPNIRHPIWVNLQEHYWTVCLWVPGAICDILGGFGVLQGDTVSDPWRSPEYLIVSQMFLDTCEQQLNLGLSFLHSYWTQ